MLDKNTMYKRLLRKSKKQLVRLCGYSNIKQMYKDAADKDILSKKKIARTLVHFV